MDMEVEDAGPQEGEVALEATTEVNAAAVIEEEDLLNLDSDEVDGLAEDFYVTFFTAVQEFYHRQSFCDLAIFCGKSSKTEAPSVVRCHALVLASLVPAVKNLLRLSEWDPKEEAHVLQLPDIDYQVVKSFVDDIYDKLSHSTDDFELDVNPDLAKVLGIQSADGQGGNNYDSCLVTAAVEKAAKIIPHSAIPRTQTGEVDYEAFNKNAHLAKAMKVETEKAEIVAAAAARAAAAEAAKIAAVVKSVKPSSKTSGIELNKSGPNPFLKIAQPPAITDLIQIVDGKVKVSQGQGSSFKPLEQAVKETNQLASSSNQQTAAPAEARGIKRPAPAAENAAAPAEPQPQPPPSPPKKQPELPTPAIFNDEPPTKYNTMCNVFSKASFGRIETAVFGFIRNNGIFRAVTQPYYTTPKVTDDRGNIMITSAGAARQFRMKLPQKSLVALVAVGRRDGVNIATTLSIKSVSAQQKNAKWYDEKTMVNLINMIKNVCGTSFGVILRHPRCSESLRSKISRELVDKYKDTFKNLSKLEKTNIATEGHVYLKEFDNEAPRLQLDPLPSKPHKLEFNLVPHIKNADITDYALVSGDSAKHLTIRSFFNLNYQSIPDIRKITILLDTMACFLNLGDKRLMDFRILRETFETYAKRTCQNLAVQELGVVGNMSAEAQPAELSATAIMADDTRFSIASGNKDNLEQVLNLPPPTRTKKGKVRGPPRQQPLPGERFKCNIGDCPDIFSDSRGLNQHITRMHSMAPLRDTDGRVKGVDGDAPPPQSCLLCGKLMRDDGDMKRHMYYYHKEVKCKQCGEEFIGHHLLAAHLSKNHTEMLQCDVCGTECKGRTRLRLHKINKHMEDHQKPFQCTICGKGFAEKMKLKSHQMSLHIRTRPYKCRIEGCTADFNELANRNSHEKTVHKYDYKKRVMQIDKPPGGANANAANHLEDETAQAVHFMRD